MEVHKSIKDMVDAKVLDVKHRREWLAKHCIITASARIVYEDWDDSQQSYKSTVTIKSSVQPQSYVLREIARDAVTNIVGTSKPIRRDLHYTHTGPALRLDVTAYSRDYEDSLEQLEAQLKLAYDRYVDKQAELDAKPTETKLVHHEYDDESPDAPRWDGLIVDIAGKGRYYIERGLHVWAQIPITWDDKNWPAKSDGYGHSVAMLAYLDRDRHKGRYYPTNPNTRAYTPTKEDRDAVLGLYSWYTHG